MHDVLAEIIRHKRLDPGTRHITAAQKQAAQSLYRRGLITFDQHYCWTATEAGCLAHMASNTMPG